MTSPKRNILLWTILIAGISFRLVQYFFDRSLWLDETSLAINIVQRGYSGLLHPLDHNQIAPVLFLLIERFFITLLGPSGYAFRLFPLLSALCSMPLFYIVVNKLTGDRRIALISVFIFSFSSMMIYYSSEVKQYATDVLCTLALVYFFQEATSAGNKRKWLYLLGISGIISIFLSNISVILLLVFTFYFIFIFIKNRKAEIPVLITGTILWAFFGLYFLLFIFHHPNEARMIAYWKNDFMPLNIFSLHFWQWMFTAFTSTFGSLISFYNPQTLQIIIYVCLYFIMMMTGTFYLFRDKKWKLLYLLVAPILIHLIISAFHRYPFNTRLILYLYPFFIILISTGFISFYDEMKKVVRNRWIPYIFLAFALLIIPVEMVKIFPLQREEIRDSISFMNENISPGQEIYLYYGACQAFEFYKETGFVRFDNKATRGRMNKTEWSKYIAEINRQNGQVWLLFSHIYPFNKPETEETYIVKNLGLDWKLLKQFHAKGSAAYLVERSSLEPGK
jgi:uncharacterized membrane protein